VVKGLAAVPRAAPVASGNRAQEKINRDGARRARHRGF
jgi:hypothetical protein